MATPCYRGVAYSIVQEQEGRAFPLWFRFGLLYLGASIRFAYCADCRIVKVGLARRAGLASSCFDGWKIGIDIRL